MPVLETIQTVRNIQGSINFAFFSYLFEILLIILIGRLTKDKPYSYDTVITNGVVVFMAAGTLLFDQRPIGFLLLAYAAFLLAMGVKELEELKYNREEFIGKIVKFFGHYITVSVILLIIMIWEYIVTLFL